MVVRILVFLLFPTFVIMDDEKPQQIHLSYGDIPNQMVVTWSTLKKSEKSYVFYGKNDLDSKVIANTTHCSFLNQYIHRATLSDLDLGSSYVYSIGKHKDDSKKFTFRTSPDYDKPLKILVFGDLGLKNAITLPHLIKDTKKGDVDFVIHLGDLAYDLNSQHGTVGDKFMKSIQDISASVPYMTCAGNHESKKNFTHYKSRFSMPQYERHDSMFYSFNSGPAHFVAFNEEIYYSDETLDEDSLATHYNWLREDLAAANTNEERTKRPWIIMFSHRPMYCTGEDKTCWKKSGMNVPNRIGKNINGELKMGLEPLLKEFGVDLVLTAHFHVYERMYPIYNLTLHAGKDEPYRNPQAPVHLISAAAGNKNRIDKFADNPPAWSAFRDSTYSYTRMSIVNFTHLYWEQVSVDDDKIMAEYKPKVIDSIWLVKDEHKPYHYDD